MPALTAWRTAAQIRATRPNVAGASDEAIESLIAEFEELAERYIGAAFIPRDATYIGYPVDGVLELPHLQVSAVTSCEDDDGNAVAYTTLHTARGALDVSTHVRLTVEYTHGFDAPTARLAGACDRWVERMVIVDRSGTSRDVLSQSFEGGTTRYSTPDWDAGRPTGFLVVDEALNAARSHLIRIY